MFEFFGVLFCYFLVVAIVVTIIYSVYVYDKLVIEEEEKATYKPVLTVEMGMPYRQSQKIVDRLLKEDRKRSRR